VRAYAVALRGETVEWEGALIKMLHPDGFGTRSHIPATSRSWTPWLNYRWRGIRCGSPWGHSERSRRTAGTSHRSLASSSW